MRRTRRYGFTLAEVLVTVAIIGTLAAVLLPALIGQMSKGDASRAAEDLKAVQTAVTAFVSDVRRYPGNLVHLTNAVAITDQDVLNANYPANLAGKWKGPYLDKQLSAGNLKTSFGSELLGDLDTFLWVSTTYVSLKMSPISLTDFNKLDAVIDETANSTTGLFQYVGNATTGTASYLMVPVQ